MNSKKVHVALERKADVSNTQPERHTALRKAAESLSLRNVDQAVCELFNEALARLVQLAYEQDAGGYCNIDGVTGKLLIPLPWGRNGHQQWSLRPQEAEILRQILFDWQQPGPTLLIYDRARRSWRVNLFDFGNIHLAKQWLAKYQVSIATYRASRSKRVGGE